MAGGRAKTGNASSHVRKHMREMQGLVDLWRADRATRLRKRKLDLEEMVAKPASAKRVRVHASDLPRRVQRNMQTLMVRMLVKHGIAPTTLAASPEWNAFVAGPDGLLPGFTSPAKETYVSSDHGR